MIPAQAIKAAAKYLSLLMADPNGDYTMEARDLLEAAAPHMLAQAWREGYMYSYDQERGGNGELPIPVPEYLTDDLAQWNPYRPTK